MQYIHGAGRNKGKEKERGDPVGRWNNQLMALLEELPVVNLTLIRTVA